MRMKRAPKNSEAAPRKRATNLFVDAELLARARTLGIGVSGVLEESLRLRVRQEEERCWREENKEAIAAINRETAKRGVWSKRLRRF